MAVFDTDLDYTQLIQFTNGTLQLGSFVQIRNALIKRMKEIYGNDIDISPASADGQYINSIALLFNNIFQTIKKGNDSIDPTIATGQYLDTLCSFNNIFRIEPTNSIAQLYIYNHTGAPYTTNYLTFIDKNNTLWIWDNGGVDITIPVPTEKEPCFLLTNVKCEQLGSISAPGANAFFKYDPINEKWDKTGSDDPHSQTWDRGDLYNDSDMNGTIYQCIDDNGLWVWQYSNVELGENRETDEGLRSRRYQMLGNNSVTVLEGLKGNLLNINGIKDVYIFNNQAGGDGTVVLNIANGFKYIADETSLKGHSIYITIRYKEGVVIEDSVIGKLIYDKLTPGISTSPCVDTKTNTYILTTQEPADWAWNYKGYYTVVATQNSSNVWNPISYYMFDSTTNTYTLVLDKPVDWDTTYTNYYTLVKTQVASVTPWAADTFYKPGCYKSLEVVRTTNFSDFIYWKKAEIIKPKIVLNFQTNPKLYDYPLDSNDTLITTEHTPSNVIEKSIVESLQKYLSEIPLNGSIIISEALNNMQLGDIQKNGMSTFFGLTGYIWNANQYEYPLNLSYLKYDENDFKFEYTFNNGLPTGAATITIGGYKI